MNFEEMFSDLAPKRNATVIGGHSFYARPMTVSEFCAHINNPNKNERDDLAILNCIEDDEGKPIFDSIDRVKALYSTVRSELAMAVATMTIFLPPVEVEQSVKTVGSNSSNTDK